MATSVIVVAEQNAQSPSYFDRTQGPTYLKTTLFETSFTKLTLYLVKVSFKMCGL